MKQNTFWMEAGDAASLPDVCPTSWPEISNIYMKISLKNAYHCAVKEKQGT